MTDRHVPAVAVAEELRRRRVSGVDDSTLARALSTGRSHVHKRHPARWLSVVDSVRRGLCTFVGTPPSLRVDHRRAGRADDGVIG
jgi:hypothetical protein